MDESGSRTARVVAVGRAVGVGGRRDALVASLLPATDRAAAGAARALGLGRSDRVFGWSGHPGLRMLAVDAELRTALRTTGATTVVVVGAGYDTRAWRLEELRGCRVVEVDHPDTQAAKQRRLADAGAPLARLDLAGADLARDDLGEVLETAGHDADVPTVWLWEAVVPYLPAVAVDRTLAVLRERSAPGSRLLVTTVTPELVEPAAVGRVVGAPARWLMDRIGEPVRLAESDDDVAARLGRHGFAHVRVTGARRWAADAGLHLHGPHLAERLHVADRAVGS